MSPFRPTGIPRLRILLATTLLLFVGAGIEPADASRRLQVVAAPDEEFTRRADWEEQILAAVEAVSAAMDQDFGLEVRILRIERWTSRAPDHDLAALREELKESIAPWDADIVIGFCGRVSPESNRRLRRLGQSDTPGRYIVVTDLAGRDLPLVLRHELAHAFGVPHVAGVASLMAPDIRSEWDMFDTVSAAILRNNLELRFADDDPLGGVRLDVLEDLYARLARDGNDVADLISSVGDSWRHRGEPDRAALRYREALELDETVLGAHLGLGKLAMLSERYEDAITAFETARTLDPSVARLDMNLGLAYVALERVSEAHDAYRRAIELDPADFGALNNLGLLLFDENRLEEAEELFLRAVSTRPVYAEGWNNLGMLYGETDRPDEAMAALERALEIRETPMAHRNLAAVLIRLGRRLEAKSHLEAAHRLTSADATADR